MPGLTRTIHPPGSRRAGCLPAVRPRAPRHPARGRPAGRARLAQVGSSLGRGSRDPETASRAAGWLGVAAMVAGGVSWGTLLVLFGG